MQDQRAEMMTKDLVYTRWKVFSNKLGQKELQLFSWQPYLNHFTFFFVDNPISEDSILRDFSVWVI